MAGDDSARGHVIVEDGRLGESVGFGNLISRRIDPVVLRRPSA
jgi:hypothetical protein